MLPLFASVAAEDGPHPRPVPPTNSLLMGGRTISQFWESGVFKRSWSCSGNAHSG